MTNPTFPNIFTLCIFKDELLEIPEVKDRIDNNTWSKE